MNVQIIYLIIYIYISPMRNPFDPKEQEAVGICNYISKGSQVLAITKYLLTDFIVNEINPEGQLVTLHKKPQIVNMVKKQQPKYQMTKQIQQQCRAILGEKITQQLCTLYQDIQSGAKPTWECKIQAPKVKQQRSKIHNFIRENLHNIESSTVDTNIKLQYRKNLKKKNPLGRKKYIHFTLFKSNIDTAGALYKLYKITGINQKLFSTAGLKDKRGVTTQRVSVYNSELQQLNRFFLQSQKNKEMWIADFLEHQNNPISVGYLQGNQFGLILRLIKSQDAQTVVQRIESLSTNGMINYFGLQRFGSYAVKTHHIGVQVIKKNWKKVIEILVLSQTGNADIDALKQQLYYNQLYSEAERSLPSRNKIERIVFKGLARHGENYPNVFDSLPRSMKSIYVHAVQSYIWNRVTSKRLSDHGFNLVEGDLVGNKISEKHQQQKGQDQEEEEGHGQENQVQGEEAVDELQEYEITVINKQNINNYTIHDLVAPLYGPGVVLPSQSLMAQYFKQEFQGLNLTEGDFTQNASLLCFQGRFRKMITRPNVVKYKIIKHQNTGDELQSPYYTLGQELQVIPGPLTSIQLVISLPKSCYATMALRQILHISSSIEVQKELNQLYNQSNTKNQ